MWKKLVFILILTALFAACTQGSSNQAGPGQGQGSGQGQGQAQSQGANQAGATQPVAANDSPSHTPTPEQAAGQPGTAAFPGLPLPFDRGTLFSGSGACAVCHTQTIDQAGANVSTDALWRASMLANAARDPYWRATVRSETSQAPGHAAIIEKACATCHMPMAATTLANGGQEVPILDQGLVDANHPLHNLAQDGVSCTLCHQIEAATFTQPESHSGGFLVDTLLPQGERLAYGPFRSGANLVTIMQGSSGFIPRQSAHVKQAEMCASCHDLYTPYLDASGEVAGQFPEQLIYSEWANSAYAADTPCQTCHMPQAQGSVKLSITGGPARTPVLQHTFVGGNAYMLSLLQNNAEALQVSAAPEHFDSSIARTRQQIETQTARLTISQPAIVNGLLQAEISIENLAGHKFPAGYPSRRAWLQVRVTDKDGQVVFESGAVDATGAILGNDNDQDASRYEPHYTLLNSPDQVQIYEAIMANSDGQVTTTLLRGASYLKDNRLLPSGFQSNPQLPEIEPQGEASLDDSFTAGSDSLSLQIDLGQAQGPFTLEVSLLYQSIAYRWAQNLLQQAGGEVQQFGLMYASQPNLPLIVASAATTVNP